MLKPSNSQRINLDIPYDFLHDALAGVLAGVLAGAVGVPETMNN